MNASLPDFVRRAKSHLRATLPRIAVLGQLTAAEGPSFGIAPAGMWMWMSLFSRKSLEMPSFSAFVRTYERAACADSFMTSPS